LPNLKQSIGWLLDQLLPAACPLCHCTFPTDWRKPFCSDCLAGFKPLPSARCSCCALPFQVVSGSSHLCGRCSVVFPPFNKVYCLGLYDLTLRKAIHQFKFNQRVGLDRPLACLLELAIDVNCQFDLIIPVPLHRQRLRQRSYNQSLLLAKELGRLRKLPVAANRLLKVRATLPQQGLSARERESNLRSAFLVPRRLAGERILLVDDVMTTGATLTATSKLLLKNGAKEVQVAVLGRAPSETRS